MRNQGNILSCVEVISLMLQELLFFFTRMGDHMVLCVDRLNKPESLQSLPGTTAPGSSLESSSSQNSEPPVCAIAVEDVDEHDGSEEDPLIQSVECRICQEEDSIKNLEIPCACSGSLKVPFTNFYGNGPCSLTKWFSGHETSLSENHHILLM